MLLPAGNDSIGCAMKQSRDSSTTLDALSADSAGSIRRRVSCALKTANGEVKRENDPCPEQGDLAETLLIPSSPARSARVEVEEDPNRRLGARRDGGSEEARVVESVQSLVSISSLIVRCPSNGRVCKMMHRHFRAHFINILGDFDK